MQAVCGSLQRVAAWRDRGAGADVVPLEFAIKSCSANPQHLTRHCFVALYLLENSLDRGPFDDLQIRRISAGAGRVWVTFSFERMGSDRGWKVVKVNSPAVAQCECSFDTVLQFADVARPPVQHERLHGRSRNLNFCTLGIALQKPMCQHGNIGAPLAK